MPSPVGVIEVITGAMFSGKTEELIRRLKRAAAASSKPAQAFKPLLDTRGSRGNLVSHSGTEYVAQSVLSARDIPALLGPGTSVVGIDEAQFFDESIISVTQKLAEAGIKVIIAGLDTDFRGEPFGAMPVLMAKADVVDKLRAICAICKEPACRTQRLMDGLPAPCDDPVLKIGSSDIYEPRCRRHHQFPTKQKHLLRAMTKN
jgi:thymidine kinase